MAGLRVFLLLGRRGIWVSSGMLAFSLCRVLGLGLRVSGLACFDFRVYRVLGVHGARGYLGRCGTLRA